MTTDFYLSCAIAFGGRRYEVVNVRTGERFGNHTYAEAVARAQAMRRNWNYKEQFKVVER